MQDALKPANQRRLAVIGLGYVGLPLAVAFAQRQPVVGFDVDPERIDQLKRGHDRTLEVDQQELATATGLVLTTDIADLAECDVYIVSVPTPIDKHKRPDLSPLLGASRLVGQVLKPGDVVVYESTVYPGATEEDCVPVLEQESGLVFNQDFFCGYSPERINPGDKTHRLADIRKVVSGSTPAIAELVDGLYSEIIHAGTYRASSIRVAEAAKVIENTQRDVNIALVNELAMLFNRMGLDTGEVLEAAGTKWNFLPFRPGLVGGHCIGVDPYYLTHKAQQVGHHPEMILAGRRINDGMGAYVAGQLVKVMLQRHIEMKTARVLILGVTFKENCPDLRNTHVIDVVRELEDYGLAVDVHDPWADPVCARREFGIELKVEPPTSFYDGIILAVAHREFAAMGADLIRAFGHPDHVLYDLKGVLPPERVDLRL